MEELQALYERYASECFYYAFHFTKNCEEAEQLVSDAFYQLLENVETIPENAVKFWLFKVIKHRFLDGQRSKKRWQRWFSRYRPEEPSVTPLEHLIQSEEKQRLYRGIAVLVPQDQELIWLHYFQDWSIQELAEYNQWTYSQTKNRLYRVRQKLKEVLKDGPRI